MPQNCFARIYSRMDVSIVLVNANVLTMDTSLPRAEAVAVAGERFVAVGLSEDILRLSNARTRVIDCQGLTLLPGFNDAHCHLPGLARRLQDLDCGPQYAPSIAALQALIRQRSISRPPGSWVRGFGYDDLQLAEGRHPDRHDLDVASPGHPVWLEHHSGHASALNSRALELADIRVDTPDPPGGIIERDLATGEPTGTLLEMQALLRRRLGSIRDPREFRDGMKAVDRLLLSYGITSVQDAGADNGVERWQTFNSLLQDGVLSGRITMFAGIERLGEVANAGLGFGESRNRLRVGHAKIMLTLTAGSLSPSRAELTEMVGEAHRRGFPVAIHCIEEEAIAAAAQVLADVHPPPEGEGVLLGDHEGVLVGDRIEHCAEGTPAALELVGQSGAMVVTQPGFIFHNGPSYRRNAQRLLLPHLYPAGALLRAGIPTAFSSDAPVIDPNPWPAIYSAVTRLTSDGRPLSSGLADIQQVSVAEALRMYTLAGAQAEGTSSEKGAIAAGKLADMVLVDANPLAVDSERLQSVKAVMTITGGEVVWGQV